jgi:hypothetical protein
MKTYGGVDVQTHVFLTSAIVGGEWSPSYPDRFNPGETAPGTHWIGGWVGPRVGVDDMEIRKFLPPLGLELRPLSRPARSQLLQWLRYPGSWKVEENHKQKRNSIRIFEPDAYGVRSRNCDCLYSDVQWTALRFNDTSNKPVGQSLTHLQSAPPPCYRQFTALYIRQEVRLFLKYYIWQEDVAGRGA